MDVHYFYRAVFPEVFAELGNVNVHAAAIEVGIATPYALEGSFAGQEVVLVFAQHKQELVLFGRECMRIVAVLQRAQLTIKMVCADVELDLRVVLIVHFLVAFQDGLYFMKQYFAVEWLGDIVIGTQFVAGKDVVLHAFGREEEQGYVRIYIAYFFCQCEAVHVRHHDIEEAHIEALPAKSREAKDTIAGELYYKVVELQVAFQHHSEISIVFNKQYFIFLVFH